jgi:hypothetical protein
MLVNPNEIAAATAWLRGDGRRSRLCERSEAIFIRSPRALQGLKMTTDRCNDIGIARSPATKQSQ